MGSPSNSGSAFTISSTPAAIRTNSVLGSLSSLNTFDDVGSNSLNGGNRTISISSKGSYLSKTHECDSRLPLSIV